MELKHCDHWGLGLHSLWASWAPCSFLSAQTSLLLTCCCCCCVDSYIVAMIWYFWVAGPDAQCLHICRQLPAKNPTLKQPRKPSLWIGSRALDNNHVWPCLSANCMSMGNNDATQMATQHQSMQNFTTVAHNDNENADANKSLQNPGQRP